VINNVKKYKRHQVKLNDSKSFKGTPQRCIDFTAYLSSSKNDITESNNDKHSIDNTLKKYNSNSKLKQPSTEKKSSRYDYKVEDYVKQLKQLKLDIHTPKLSERLLNIKISSKVSQ